jgi:putative transposase
VDLVERMFSREAPNRLWVTDITEHRTYEGKVYCAVVLDTFSRRVVGWSTDTSQTAALVTNAPGMAIANREPGVIVHSDHGVQFTSWAFTGRAKRSGLVPSMGSIGHCYDNAVIESFWGRMKPSYSTENTGRHASNWPTPSSTTWKSSTTASADILCALR